MPIRENKAAVVAGLLLSLATAATPTPAAPVLRVGAIPDQNPEKLNRLYGALSSELGEQLKVKVRYVPVSNYTAAVSAFRAGSLDLVWFGGLTGVQARLQTPGARVLAQRDIDARFTSVFIANGSSGLRPLSSQDQLIQLKGKRFTFGSESSTSGRLMPQYFMQQVGVLPSQFAGGRPGFSGSHDATIALVQSGAYQVGALNEQVWKSNVKNGRIDPAKVRVIWRTPSYVDYHWVARPGLDQRFGAGFTQRIQTTLIGLEPDTSRRELVLSLFGAKRFIPANANDYAAIEKVGRQLGKIR
ncbi:putative selenate ABC transporter substrate-binding protein [Synechococcus sp. MIT S1220]|uniref:putative selenate ABC transporter substrate-binding protein n=1 Tax=Synechococcus sp. MIT S1220 TaxID=3082549 RepID=UPI0039AEDA0C